VDFPDKWHSVYPTWRAGLPDAHLRKTIGMTNSPNMDAFLTSPSVACNRDPILDVLRRFLPRAGLVLEIASRTGEHAVHFAAALPHLMWLPTDQDERALNSIAAHRSASGLPNLLAPLRLDAAAPN
jgi:tRNA G46 methylase TrmB